jgi:hypothetical protein
LKLSFWVSLRSDATASITSVLKNIERKPGAAILQKLVLGIPAQASGKNHVTAHTCGILVTLLSSFYTQQGVNALVTQ